MKSFNKIFALVLTVAILFTVSGCGEKQVTSNASETGVDADFFTDTEVNVGNTDGGSEENDSSNDASVPKQNVISGKSWKDVLSSMPKNLRGTTITVYNWNPANEYTGAPSAIKKFESKTGIKVSWKTENYSTYLSKLASLVASDNAPDVVRLRTPDPVGLISIQPIDATGYDFNDAAWDKILMNSYTINGKTYGLSLKNTHIGSVNMMFYNTTLISKYDFEDPYQLWKQGKWTWTKFKDMCREYKKASNAEFACGGLSGWEGFSEMFGVEGPVGFKDGKYYNRCNDAEFRTITQELADLFNTEMLFAVNKSDEFDSGIGLFWSGASVYARRNNSYLASLKKAGSLNVVPMPTVEGQGTYYQAKDEYEAYGIADGAKNAAAVPYFLRYFLDAANYDLNSFFSSKQAIEVYNWCMNQENTIWTTYYDVNWRYLGGSSDIFGEAYKTQTGSQVASFLQSNSAVIDSRVKKLNDSVNKLKK